MAGLEGQKAPAFTLAGSDGKQHSLAEYAGKNVILWFYPKDDTPAEPRKRGFRDAIDTCKKANTVVVGVSARMA
jgi:peroxiredoxin Q/BCP